MMISQNLQKITIGLLVVLIIGLGLATLIRIKPSAKPTPASSTTSNEQNVDNDSKPKGRPLGILITDPNLKAIITSPVLVKGSASADNFSAGKISFKIIDETGEVFGQGEAAQGTEQTAGYFNFETSLEFKAGAKGLGFIIINDNPNFRFPIQF